MSSEHNGGTGVAVELDDRLVRVIGIPLFGIIVPRVSGVLDGHSMSSPLYWVGSAWAVLAVAAVCHGTRGAYLAQRRVGDWMAQPFRKLTRLLAVILLFTVPPTLLALVGWNALLGTAAWRPALLTLAVAVAGVVLMIYLYEFAFLLKERAAGRSRLLGLRRARVEAELAAFGAKVDPHFLFNSLNTLGHLISTDPRRAALFNARLAELHRYVLRTCSKGLVTLQEELEFLRDYVALMAIRFGAAFEVKIVDEGVDRHCSLPPTALQALVENAIKHNEIGEGCPLVVAVTLGETAVTVRNDHRPCKTARPSAGVGLRNLAERLQLTSGSRLIVERRGGAFIVTVPLVPATPSRCATARRTGVAAHVSASTSSDVTPELSIAAGPSLSIYPDWTSRRPG